MVTQTTQKAATASYTRKMVSIAMLAAVSIVLSYLTVTPPLSPSFVKLDVSDFPAMIAAFTFGPVAGMLVVLIKNLIGLISSATGSIGELANFCMGASMAIGAGLIYRINRTRKGAFLGMAVGTLAMVLVSCLANYFVLLPLYTAFMPMDAIIAAFSAFIPAIKTRLDVILLSTIPFNLLKGVLLSLLTMMLYKKLSPMLRGKA